MNTSGLWLCGKTENVKLSGSRIELIPNTIMYNNLILILLLKNSNEIFSYAVISVSSRNA